MAEIDVSVRNGVALVTLNAPERRNALTPEMARLLFDVCDDIDGDKSVGAAVITGAGGHFCAGAHRRVLEIAGRDPADPDSYEENNIVYASFVRVGHLAVPSIAAVRGAVVGAGLNLMMATDLRVIALDARILAGFLRIGIHPGGGHFALMGRGAGWETTAALSVFSQEINGDKARELGLAWSSAGAEDVVDQALEIASGPAADPALARAAVSSFRMAFGPPALPWDAALRAERATQMWSLRRRELNKPGATTNG